MGRLMPLPAESTKEHTRILRVMLAAQDSAAYWRAPVLDAPLPVRAEAAFRGHWFGTKSEARVKTLMADMALRFDAYPVALTALRAWCPPQEIAPWVCHFHVQLADPIYRRFTGEFLPDRLLKGYAEVDREGVARWVQEQWPGRWSAATCMKFGSNLLATAYEAGLLRDRKDPRKLAAPRPPPLAFEYLLYLLREVVLSQRMLESPYVRSVAPDQDALAVLLRSAPNVQLRSLGNVHEFDWSYPSLLSWARARAEEAAGGAA